MNNWYLLAAIPVFGLLVLVHEFGHFITAKWSGIRVEEFGLGFPPRFVGVRKKKVGGWEVIWFGGRRDEADSDGSQKQTPFSGTSGGVTSATADEGTIYSLNWIPIGGFVRMPGENGDINDENGNYDPQSFAAKPAGKRIIVLVAGVTMNFLLAMLLFSIAFTQGEPTFPAVVGKVVAGSPADHAGLRAKDTILSANGQPVQLFTDLQDIVTKAITKDEAAHPANKNNPNATLPVAIVFKHAGNTQQISTTVNVREDPPSGQGPMGIENTVVYVSSPLWQAPIKGVEYTFTVTGQFFQYIGQVISGAQTLQLAGPVGIVKVTGEIAQSVPNLGWWPILSLTAVLSLNLAIMNILPFPALDGGRVVLVLVEVLRGGKRLKPEREGIINLVGMAILLTFIAIVTVSDILHWGS